MDLILLRSGSTMSEFTIQELLHHDFFRMAKGKYYQLPDLFQDMVCKFINKGFIVGLGRSLSSGAIGIRDHLSHDSSPKGYIKIDERDGEYRINYGTSFLEGSQVWDSYEDIGSQIRFYLKGREEVEFEGEPGREIKVTEW